MELWIRSQDKSALVKTDNVLFNIEELEICSVLTTQCSKVSLGKYKSEERALEVLDEIQNQLKDKYLMKQISGVHFGSNSIKGAKKYFEKLNKVPLITGDDNFEIVPINNGVIVYEMPQE